MSFVKQANISTPRKSFMPKMPSLSSLFPQIRDSIEELHSVGATEPIVTNNYFALTITVDATFKGMGKMLIVEVAVYEVKDGKVVKEQFFY